jgi:hypothetical protein
MLLMESIASGNLEGIRKALADATLRKRDVHAAMLNAVAKKNKNCVEAILLYFVETKQKVNEATVSHALLIAAKMSSGKTKSNKKQQ